MPAHGPNRTYLIATSAAARAHVIAGIEYCGNLPGEDGSYPAAPLRCECGWSGVSAEWSEHRRDAGARKATARNRSTGPSVWDSVSPERRAT